MIPLKESVQHRFRRRPGHVSTNDSAEKVEKQETDAPPMLTGLKIIDVL